MENESPKTCKPFSKVISNTKSIIPIHLFWLENLVYLWMYGEFWSESCSGQELVGLAGTTQWVDQTWRETFWILHKVTWMLKILLCTHECKLLVYSSLMSPIISTIIVNNQWNTMTICIYSQWTCVTRRYVWVDIRDAWVTISQHKLAAHAVPTHAHGGQIQNLSFLKGIRSSFFADVETYFLNWQGRKLSL